MLLQRRGMRLFSVGDVDVSVSLWYGILMGFIVFLSPAMGGATVTAGVLMAVAVTISLLIHDFAHALVAKRYGLKPSIQLLAFGGFCLTEREAQSDGDDAKMALAGPVTSLAVAGAVAAVMVWMPALAQASPVTQTLLPVLLWFNLGWGLFNLLVPVWPYDGGRLFHLLLRQFKSEKKARTWALQASIFAIIPVGIVGLVQFMSLLVALLAVFVVMDNVQRLRSGAPLIRRKSDRAKNTASDFHEELLEDAEKAMAEQDWDEAARLAHHMRSVGSMPDNMLDRVWTILGVATTEMGNYDEALSYLDRAPDNSEVRRAKRRCNDELNDAQPAQ